MAAFSSSLKGSPLTGGLFEPFKEYDITVHNEISHTLFRTLHTKDKSSLVYSSHHTPRAQFGAYCMRKHPLDPLTELSGNCLLILFGSHRNSTKLFRERDTVQRVRFCGQPPRMRRLWLPRSYLPPTDVQWPSNARQTRRSRALFLTAGQAPEAHPGTNGTSIHTWQ